VRPHTLSSRSVLRAPSAGCKACQALRVPLERKVVRVIRDPREKRVDQATPRFLMGRPTARKSVGCRSGKAPLLHPAWSFRRTGRSRPAAAFSPRMGMPGGTSARAACFQTRHSSAGPSRRRCRQSPGHGRSRPAGGRVDGENVPPPAHLSRAKFHCVCLRRARRADFYDAMDRDIVYPNLGIY